MKKFRFRLDTLLKFRKIEEEQAQIKLAEASSCLRKEQKLLGEYQNRLTVTLELLNLEHTGCPTIETLKTFSNYIDKTKSDIITQQEQVTKAVAYRQECLVILESAIKQRKLVANLRTKRLDQYKTELLQEEQKNLDELGTQAFVRNKESVLA